LQGLFVHDLTPDVRQRYKGFWAVSITSVQPGSTADAAGFRIGDIIKSLVLGGDNKPSPTGTPTEFRKAVKRCTPSCLIEFHREGESEIGFMLIGQPETDFVSIYGRVSKVLLAYRDVRTQKLYEARTLARPSDPDDQLLAAEPSGLIASTTNGENQRAAPMSIRYRPKGPDDQKPWSVTVAGADDAPITPNKPSSSSDEATLIQSVPLESGLAGVRVKVATFSPTDASLQFGLSPKEDMRMVVVEGIDPLEGNQAGNLRQGDAISSIYVAGSQPYVKGEGGTKQEDAATFYRASALCIPDCLLRIRHPGERTDRLLWVHSATRVTEDGAIPDNFQESRRPDSTIAFMDTRSKISYEPAKGGGVLLRDGVTGKLLGALSISSQTAAEWRLKCNRRQAQRPALCARCSRRCNRAIRLSKLPPQYREG
jgi:hypothetical protein